MPSPAHRASWSLTIASKAIAIAILYCFFVVVPPLIQPKWNQIVNFFGGEFGVVTYGVMTTHLVVLLFMNTIFATLYYLRLPFFEQFKISPKKWNFEVPEKLQECRNLIYFAIGLTLFNNFVLGLPAAMINYDMAKKLGLSVAIEDFPGPMKLFLTIIACMVIEDATFYTSHRTLHTFKPLYAHIHKLHHRYYQSLSIAAEFAHPIEFLFGNAIPFALGPTLLGAHGYTWLAWTVFRIGETVEGHCGYDFPWAPWTLFPFSGSSAFHDAHHSINTGNFASFFVWWDKLFGTDIPTATLEKVIYEKTAPNTHKKAASAVAASAKEE